MVGKTIEYAASMPSPAFAEDWSGFWPLMTAYSSAGNRPMQKTFARWLVQFAVLWSVASCTSTAVAPVVTDFEAVSTDNGLVAIFMDSVNEASLRITRLDGPEIVVTPFLGPGKVIEFFEMPPGQYRIVAVQIEQRVYQLEAWRYPIIQFGVSAGQINYPGTILLAALPRVVDMRRSGPQQAGTSRDTVAYDVQIRAENLENEARAYLATNYPELFDRYTLVHTGPRSQEKSPEK